MGTKNSRVEKMKKRQADLEKGSGGSYKYFLFTKEGTRRMRPLPAPDDEEFGVEVTTFFLGKEIGGVVSPTSFGGPCAIMEAYQKLLNSKNEDDKTLAAQLKPKKRYMVAHIAYLDDKGLKVDEDSGAKLALLTAGQYQDLCDLFLDDEHGDFTDPINGYDIKYKRVGKGMTDTVYSTLTCKSTKLPKKYNKIHDPLKMAKAITPTYEETQDMVKKFLKVDISSSKKKSSSKDGVVKKKKKKNRDL